MHVIAGTVPDADFPLVSGYVSFLSCDGFLSVDGRRVDVNRGTPALLAAAASASEFLGLDPVYAVIAGDIGRGEGSRSVYRNLCSFFENKMPGREIDSIAFHYLQPDVDWHNRVLFALQELSPRPAAVADAGFMYAAKMSGQAAEYDLFTPDVGELTFLADEAAPHPFYTRGFILHDSGRVPELIRRAYGSNNASKYLAVKGKSDYIADFRGILEEIHEPSEEVLEAIGGTGDTLTGIASVLCGSAMTVPEAASIAARANRVAGALSRPDPATQVIDIIRCIPAALSEVMG